PPPASGKILPPALGPLQRARPGLEDPPVVTGGPWLELRAVRPQPVLILSPRKEFLDPVQSLSHTAGVLERVGGRHLRKVVPRIDRQGQPREPLLERRGGRLLLDGSQHRRRLAHLLVTGGVIPGFRAAARSDLDRAAFREVARVPRRRRASLGRRL